MGVNPLPVYAHLHMKNVHSRGIADVLRLNRRRLIKLTIRKHTLMGILRLKQRLPILRYEHTNATTTELMAQVILSGSQQENHAIMQIKSNNDADN